jgi:hypothetical protein
MQKGGWRYEDNVRYKMGVVHDNHLGGMAHGWSLHEPNQ